MKLIQKRMVALQNLIVIVLTESHPMGRYLKSNLSGTDAGVYLPG
jgi:hypothetical protein